jgi:hypothetical protein
MPNLLVIHYGEDRYALFILAQSLWRAGLRLTGYVCTSTMKIITVFIAGPIDKLTAMVWIMLWRVIQLVLTMLKQMCPRVA